MDNTLSRWLPYREICFWDMTYTNITKNALSREAWCPNGLLPSTPLYQEMREGTAQNTHLPRSHIRGVLRIEVGTLLPSRISKCLGFQVSLFAYVWSDGFTYGVKPSQVICICKVSQFSSCLVVASRVPYPQTAQAHIPTLLLQHNGTAGRLVCAQ